MTSILGSEPAVHHHCKVCKLPVAKWGIFGKERGSLLPYGPKGYCMKHYAAARGADKASVSTTAVSRLSLIRHENNVLGLQHYMERRAERMAYKCQVSM